MAAVLQAPGRHQLDAARAAGVATFEDDDTVFDLERLFDPLYRVDPSRSRAFGGSGLGLAIARAIAQAHGGQLRAEPAALGGLAVVLTLPVRPS